MTHQFGARLMASCGAWAALWFAGCAPPAPGCTEYRSASVAEMRRDFVSGCFELEHLVVAARTPSITAPRVYVQDAGGGDFSAIALKCVSGRHACSAGNKAKLLALSEGASVTVRGPYHRGKQSGIEELQIDELVDEGTQAAVPKVRSVPLSDLTRDGVARASWFQVSSVVVPANEPLVVYDLSPEELALTGPCPRWSGFGMIARSHGKPEAHACVGAENPPARATPDAHEVLLGRQFFDAFSWTGDCACAAQSKQRLVQPSDSFSGTMRGVLARESDVSAPNGFQIFHPLSLSECTSYRPSSVAAMRQAGISGCFELSHLVVTARTPSTLTPRVYVQDPAGGDYSAIMAQCDETATHACATATAASTLKLIDGAAVTVRGFYEHAVGSGLEALHLDEVIDEGNLLKLPAPVRLEVADLERGARTRAQWFRLGIVTVPDTDPLVVYDLSPPEFKLTGPCPAWGGFGLIALSAGTEPPSDCSAGKNPAGLQAPDPREVLIGRQFYDAFSWSTDCACAEASKQHLLTPLNSVAGPMQGILLLDQSKTASEPYQVFEPISKAVFPVQ